MLKLILTTQIHFRGEHYLCEDEGCLANKFVVFATESEMKVISYCLCNCGAHFPFICDIILTSASCPFACHSDSCISEIFKYPMTKFCICRGIMPRNMEGTCLVLSVMQFFRYFVDLLNSCQHQQGLICTPYFWHIP